MNLIMKDLSKRWIQQQPIENYEAHWNSPQPNTKPRRFLFAALVIAAVFLLLFGNQITHADGIENIQQNSSLVNKAAPSEASKKSTHKNFSGFENDPCKYDEDVFWPGHICTDPTYYDPRYTHYFVGPLPNNLGTVPEPGTTLTIGLGLIALAINVSRASKAYVRLNVSGLKKIAAGALEHRKTSSNKTRCNAQCANTSGQ